MLSQEQMAFVRNWFADAVESLPKAIEQEIAGIGGRDMLLQRIDVLYWVYVTEEEVEMYREALRFLDGEKNIDMSLVNAAIQRRKSCYQSIVMEIGSLREEICEKEELLKQNEEKLPELRLTVKALEEALKEYGGQA